MTILDIKMHFNTEDVRANIEAVNRMCEKSFRDLENRINKVSKIVSNRIAVTKTELAAASEYVSKAVTEITIPLGLIEIAIGISNLIMTTIALKHQLKDAAKEADGAAQTSKRNIDDVMKSLECRMKQGSKLANDLYDALMECSMKLKATQEGAFMAERESLIVAYDKLIAAGYGKEFKKVYNEYIKYEKRLEEGFKRVEKSKVCSLEIQLHAEQDVLKAMTKVRGEYSKAAIENQKSVVKDLEDQIEGVTKACIEAAKTQSGLAATTDELTSKMEELNVSQQYGLMTQDMASQKAMELVNDFNLLKQAGIAENLILNQMKDEIQQLSFWFEAFGKTAPAAFDELKQKSEAALPSFRQFLYQGKRGDLAAYDTSKQSSIWGDLPPPPTDIGDYDFGYTLKELEEQAQQFRKKDLAGWKAWADGILGLFGNMWSSIKGTYKQFETGFQDISKSWSTGAEKGGFFGGLQASLPGIGSMIGMITQIPQIVKQVWDSIKEFATSVAKLFGWMSEEEKVQKDVLRDLGATISDDLAKKIADSSKDIGDRFTAVTLHLGDIIRETDITKDNFDDFASRARDVFSLLETGMIDATQATSTLNDVFPQLADEMDKLGITFNKNMIDMIQLSQRFGLEVESIKHYVEEKLGIAIEGLTKATQNLGEVSQAEFDRLARAASAAFNELMKNGTDVAAAIDQMKTVIGNLSKVQEEFGLKGSAAFNQLKRYSNLVETNRAVIESVKGMQDVYTSLAQVGAMNQQLFKDWQMDTLANYDKLIEGGFKQNEALAMIAPNLQALKEAHETMGFKIDDNTRALIEQAEAAGLLKPDPMLQMTDAVLEMKDAVYDLIDHLAGKSPPCGSLIEAFDTALMYTKSYGKELINAFSPMPV